ncbi:MAG: hypothetical protein R3338_12500, partial [Thermoanaerobaculia bacterium]|nr:hypothetical protein [Thermoanaerobaculia bacterium]
MVEEHVPPGGPPKERTWSFAALIAAGLLLRLVTTELTLGTNDVVFWRLWADLVEEHGIVGAYAHHRYLNHPPLALAILHALSVLGELTSTNLGDLLRHLQSIADLVTVAAIWIVARRT